MACAFSGGETASFGGFWQGEDAGGVSGRIGSDEIQGVCSGRACFR